MMRGSVFAFFVLLVGFSSLSAQDVVSASSGVLQYFEGAVLLDDKPVEHQSAVFPSLRNGSVIRTVKGRAELLLTPGVYLRLDENSAIRMKSNSLVDTLLELTGGRVIVDNLNTASGSAVALVFNNSTIRFNKPGVYRIDSELGELESYSGEAEVTHREFTSKTVSTIVDSSHLYYFSLGLTTAKLGEGATDEFYDWAHNRSDVIADHNQMASVQQEEENDPDPGAGIIGIPSLPSQPNYIDPLTPRLGTFYGSSVIDPFYQTHAPFFGFFPPPPAIFVVGPTHRWPVGTKGPPTWGLRPEPRPVRWPAITPTGSSYRPGVAVRVPIRPTYRPAPLPMRPTTPVMPRAPAPHAVIGHR